MTGPEPPDVGDDASEPFQPRTATDERQIMEPGITPRDLDHDVVPTEADVRHPSSATTLRQGAFSPRQAARIAGAAYLIQYMFAVYPEFFVRPALIVTGDAARTASNIVAHAQMFRPGPPRHRDPRRTAPASVT
jgi:hypothetical protein